MGKRETPGNTPAFAPTALTAGAILPQEARWTLQRADGLPGAVVEAERDGWATPEIPVLVRGRGRARARIVPLAWLGDPAVCNPDADPGQIAVLASRLQSAGMHWSGPWRVLEQLGSEGLDSVGSYLSALREAGVHRADIWRYSESEGLVLAWAGDWRRCRSRQRCRGPRSEGGDVLRHPDRPLYEIKAGLFKGLAHPIRIRILEVLAAATETSVSELLAVTERQLVQQSGLPEIPGSTRAPRAQPHREVAGGRVTPCTTTRVRAASGSPTGRRS